MKFQAACAGVLAMTLLSVLLIDRNRDDQDSGRTTAEDESIETPGPATVPVGTLAEEFPNGVSETGLPQEDEEAAVPAIAISNDDPQSSRADGANQASAAQTDPRLNVRTQLENAFNAEERDINWSLRMESQIFSEISLVPGLAANLVEVNCRTDLCRVRLTLPAIPPPAQPDLVEFSADGALVFTAAESLEMETVAVLALGAQFETPTFVVYLRRDDSSTTQSVSEEMASFVRT